MGIVLNKVTESMTQEKKKNKGIYIIIAAFVIMTIVTIYSGTTKVKWSESLEESFESGKVNGKPLLILFVTKQGEEASICQRFATDTLTNPDIAGFVNKKFNPVRFDYDSNIKIAVKYGVKKLPAMVIVTPDDKYNIRLEGFISDGEFSSRIKGAMKQLDSKSQDGGVK